MSRKIKYFDSLFLIIKKMVAFSFGLIVYVFSFVIPRYKNRYSFGEWFGLEYKDNSMYLYEHARLDSDADSAWITKSERIIKELSRSGKKVYHEDSIQGIWFQLTSKYFISSVSSRDFNFFTIGFGAKLIQLGHGPPIKTQQLSFTRYVKVKRYIRQKTIDNIYMALSELPVFDDLLLRQYSLRPSQVIRSPTPRSDQFKNALANKGDDRSAVRSLYNIGKGDLCIIYMPTHRDEGGANNTIVNNINVIIAIINKINATSCVKLRCMVKLHFYDRHKIKHIPDNKYITVLSMDVSIPEIFLASDIFVGDYSGVAYDYMYFKKPMIGFVPDYEVYRAKNRGLHIDLNEIYGELVFNESELYSLLSRLLDLPLEDRPIPIYQSLFYRDVDLVGQSSALAWKIIKDS
jgi:CDP-glycerol glycerophosphotransferase (TagB/SpsB family)